MATRSLPSFTFVVSWSQLLIGESVPVEVPSHALNNHTPNYYWGVLVIHTPPLPYSMGVPHFVLPRHF